jgi:hypothetical protein
MCQFVRFAFVIFMLLSGVCAVNAGTPDSTAVTRLFGTSWTITEKKVPRGIFHRLRKVKKLSDESITIYNNEIHTFKNDGTYQVCPMRHRNQNEFWLDCKENDQLIYRVIRFTEEELVIDVLAKAHGADEYVRASRKYYRRKRN